MSVEQEQGSVAAETVDTTKSNMASTEVEDSSVRTSDKTISMDIETVDDLEDRNSNEDAGDISRRARDWFVHLSVEECIESLGFSDDRFLRPFLAAASWSTRPRQDELVATPFEWHSLVSIKDFLLTYDDPSAMDEKINQPDDASAESGDGLAKTQAKKTEKDVVESKENAGQEYELRIRPSADKVFRKDSDNEKDKALTNDSLFRQVRVIFPSSVDHVSKEKVTQAESLPCVTFHPSVMKTLSVEDLLGRLDSLALAAFGKQFLTIDCTKSTEARWLRRMKGCSSSLSSLPLYAFLLARFESSVVDRFLEHSEGTNRPYPKQVNLRLDDAPSNSLHGEEEESSAENYASAQETEASSEDRSGEGKETMRTKTSVVDGKARTRVVDLIKDLASKGLSLGELDVNNYDCFDKLPNKTKVVESFSSKTFDVEDLLVTPVPLLVVLLDRMRGDSLLVVDGVLKEALKSITANDLKVSEPPTSMPLSTERAAVAIKAAEPAGSSTKKKKRKTKKKKVSDPDFVVHGHALALTFIQSQKKGGSSSNGSNNVKSPPPTPAASVTEEVKSDTISDVKTNSEDGNEESGGDVCAVESEEADVAEDPPIETSPSTTDDVSESLHEDKPAAVPTTSNGEITVSRVEGVLVVAPPVSEYISSEAGTADGISASPGKQGERDDSDNWETVEVRGRGGRKKGYDRAGQGGNRGHGNGSGMMDQSFSKKTKGARTSASRKRTVHRKIVKEILSSVLDSVHAEACRRKQSRYRPVVNPWKPASPLAWSSPQKESENSPEEPIQNEGSQQRKEMTLRDVVLGKHISSGSSPKKALSVEFPSQRDKRLPRVDEQITSRGKLENSPGKNVVKRSKTPGPTPADQNTAPTYQETVSAVSTNSNAAVESKEGPIGTIDPVLKCDSSSGDTDEAPQNLERESPSPSGKVESTAPPLPTLLSPENANSATSSVASSLEVPHAGHRRHHSNSAIDVNDVGYHLLDVCDRLSRDMSLFMSRRALALNARRREREALLASLQESLSTIWPQRCSVELYGSCATQLDLPSSDLDVVVVGLDRVEMMVSPPQTPQSSHSSTGNSDNVDEGTMMDVHHMHPLHHPSQQHLHHPMHHHMRLPPYLPMSLHLNGERVVRLAAELENQPWAVHINAIPTASVPVIKVLADPTRLNNLANKSEWMAHSNPLAAQAAAVASHSQIGTSEEEVSEVLPSEVAQQFRQPQTLIPWRGSDVINGLLSLDITFEGPEHGGIGSTEFSARVVAELSQETGLHPDATPFVQVLMVLKELLAQRKLNEPYSGGLSSYALLLLLLALTRERAVIREEIERAEQQRKAMDAGDSNAAFVSPLSVPESVSEEPQGLQEYPVVDAGKGTANTETNSVKAKKKGSDQASILRPQPTKKQSKKQGKVQSPAASDQAVKSTSSSSWASIAKKNTATIQRAASQQEFRAANSGDDSSFQQSSSKTLRKPASFADAVAWPQATSVSSSRDASSMKEVSARREEFQERKGVDSRKEEDNEESKTPGERNYEPRGQPGTGFATRPPNLTPSSSTIDSSLVPAPAFFPQGLNDVIEVLCSGETTAGKLLMHFLLYYGEHFDAQATAIDISGKHERDYSSQLPIYSYLSPYIQRRTPGSIDPVTGMLTVDPIVIYDPLEGAENNNVARRCFAWNSVRWIFAQSYATLSSAVERSGTPPTAPGGKAPIEAAAVNFSQESNRTTNSYSGHVSGDLMDPSSPLLRCLLSF